MAKSLSLDLRQRVIAAIDGEAASVKPATLLPNSRVGIASHVASKRMRPSF